MRHITDKKKKKNGATHRIYILGLTSYSFAKIQITLLTSISCYFGLLSCIYSHFGPFNCCQVDPLVSLS